MPRSDRGDRGVRRDERRSVQDNDSKPNGFGPRREAMPLRGPMVKGIIKPNYKEALNYGS